MNQVIKYSATLRSFEPKAPQFFSTLNYVDNDHIINPIAVDDKKGRLAARSKIDNYEKAITQSVANGSEELGEKVNSKGLKEYFAGGSYIRELLIPKGITVVSKIWKKERMWIIASGEVTFTTEMGTKRVKAPYTEVVPHGSKVALYTHEDTLWFAITGTDGQSETEKEMIAKDYSECIYPWDKLEELEK